MSARRTRPTPSFLWSSRRDLLIHQEIWDTPRESQFLSLLQRPPLSPDSCVSAGLGPRFGGRMCAHVQLLAGDCHPVCCGL